MRYAILLFTFSCICSVSAQLNGKYSFRHIDQADGLLHTHVRSIGQDSRGFLWILTYNGLQRYDGSRFVNYPQITYNSSFGVVHDSELYVDTLHDEIWVAKVSSADRLDLLTNKIESFSLYDVLKKIRNSEIYTDENKDLWILGDYGAIQYQKDTTVIQGSYFNVNPNQNHRNNLILKDPSTGNFWLHNFAHFFIADPRTKKMYSTSDGDPEHPLLKQLRELYGDKNKLRYLMQDHYHNLWITTWTEVLHRYDPGTKKLYSYSLKDLKRKHGSADEDNTLLINSIYEDRQKNLWFGTDYTGLMLYNREKDDFNFLTSDEKISNGIKYSFSIYCIFQDRDDNIWLGTDRGISIFNPYRNYFQSIRHIDGNNASLPKYDINDLIETDDGQIMIGTWGGGISIFDSQWNFIRNVSYSNPPEYNLVWSFVKHDEGIIWAGTQGGHIHIYDPVTRTFETIHPAEVGNSTITALAKDHDGNILIGLHNGKIAVWKKAERKFHAYDKSSPGFSKYYNGVINIFFDHSGACWVATASGLQEFDVENRVYKAVYLPEHIDTLLGIMVYGIEEYNDSTLILGTAYEGVYFFNTKSKKFSRPPLMNELYGTSVYAIKKDKQDNIWLTTNFSLFKLKNDFSQQTRFNIDHTMMNAAFGSARFLELSDGRWASSTHAEIICFEPKKMGVNKDENFKVVISGFKVLDKELYIDSFILNPKKIILPYDKNFISIEFSALNFTDNRVTNYYYRLSGVDQNWSHTTSKEFADYTDLKPGEYTFEVKADKGADPSPVVSFAFIITPPWWGTFWFRTLCILVIGALIYLALRKRIKMIRHESGLKQKIAETEMMALRTQMNPHFIFNCLSSIDNLIQTDQKELATTYLSKFALLIRAILENSKSNVIPCWKDIEALKLYLDLESLRWGNKIHYQLRMDPHIQSGDYKVPPMIIQPFVENSIHHGLLNKIGADKKLDIAVELNGEGIKYTIIDNGVGRMKAAEYKSLNRSSHLPFGMQITEDRISLFNQHKNQSIKITDLYDEAHAPTGTKVEVWLHMQPTMI